MILPDGSPATVHARLYPRRAGAADVSTRQSPPVRARVVVVSDVQLYRTGVAQSLARHTGIVVAATAASIETLREALGANRIDAALVDMTMHNSVAVVRSAVAAVPAVRVVGFAVSESPREIVAFAEAGLAGYVPRDGSVDDLIAAVDGAMRGEVHGPAHAAAAQFRRLAALSSGASGPADLRTTSTPLTPREIEIVALIDEGLSNKEIARRLHIEAATVKNHVHNVLEKLRVRRRGEAAARMRGAPSRAASWSGPVPQMDRA